MTRSNDPQPVRRRTAPARRVAKPFLLLLAALVLCGCVTRPGAESLVPLAVAAPGAKLVTVLVATDRDGDGVRPVGYGSGRAGLRYETMTISVPPDHRPGRIEWTADESRNPARSFVVVRRQRLDETAFRQHIGSRLKKGGVAAVFVHGYNYSLPEAAFRLAQLTADGPGVGAPILFSWPSDAAVAGYVADRDAATYARDDLVHVLETIGSLRTDGRIVLAGHSMGGWLVMEALRQLRLQTRDDVIARFEVILAAPDIDVDVFRKQLAVVGPLSPPMTILVSKDDRALDVARRVAGDRLRVGMVDVHEPVLQDVARREDLRVVDISSLEASDGARHDRFVKFVALQAKEEGGREPASGSLQRAGAFVFDAAGAAAASPFKLAARALDRR